MTVHYDYEIKLVFLCNKLVYCVSMVLLHLLLLKETYFFMLFANIIAFKNSSVFIQKLRHENLINLIEVFRRRKRLYLVFEFVDHTVLDDLEKYPNGLSEMTVRKILWQVLRGVEFCHSHNVSILPSFWCLIVKYFIRKF